MRWLGATQTGFLAAASLVSTHADPFPLDSLRPRAVFPGDSEVSVSAGISHPGARLWTSFPATVEPAERRGDRLVFRIHSDATPGIGIVRIFGTNGISQPALVLLDPLPTVEETSTNRTSAQARSLVPRVAVESEIPDAGSYWFSVPLRRGAPLDLEVFSQRLGSPLDPWLRVVDPSGKTVATADDTAGLNGDTRLHWTATTTGLHRIEARDSTFSGGKNQRFRLRLGDPTRTNWPVILVPALVPSFLPDIAPIRPGTSGFQDTPVRLPSIVQGVLVRRRQTDTLVVDGKAGEWIGLKVATRSSGSSGDLAVHLEELGGRRITEMDASGPDDGFLGHRFEKAGRYRIRLRKLDEEAGPVPYGLWIRSGRGDLNPQADRTAFEVRPGETFPIPVTIHRRDLERAVRLRAVGLPEGFRSEEVTVEAKAKEGTLKVTVPPDAVPGTLFHLAIDGVTGDLRQRVGTRQALAKAWPSLLHPPPGFDGVIAVGIVSKSRP